MIDPLKEFIRGDRNALIQAASPPHAARAWHEARRRRAVRLRRRMSAMGWLVRLALALATALSFLFSWPEAYFLLFLCALSTWLTHGACAPIAQRYSKGLVE